MEEKRNDTANEELFYDFNFEFLEDKVCSPQVGGSFLKNIPGDASLNFMEDEFVQLFDDCIIQGANPLVAPGSAAIPNLHFPSFENKNLCKNETEKIRKKRKPKLWDSMIIKWHMKRK
jgi:hypothetical protein